MTMMVKKNRLLDIGKDKKRNEIGMPILPGRETKQIAQVLEKPWSQLIEMQGTSRWLGAAKFRSQWYMGNNKSSKWCESSSLQVGLPTQAKCWWESCEGEGKIRVRGNLDDADLSYTFAPGLDFIVIRPMLSSSAQAQWKGLQVDYRIPFLQGASDRDFYMIAPKHIRGSPNSKFVDWEGHCTDYTSLDAYRTACFVLTWLKLG